MGVGKLISCLLISPDRQQSPQFILSLVCSQGVSGKQDTEQFPSGLIAPHPLWMVNFLFQLDWFTGCPDISSDIFLNVSIRVFWDKICF